jgi:peptidyl-prolyl cis-trans isomerase SurA
MQQYYENNKQNFRWKERIDGAIFNMTSTDIANQVKGMLESGKTIDEIKKSLNSEEKVNVIISAGKFEVDNPKLPEGFQPKVGVSNIYGANNDYTLVQVQTIIPPSTKELKEVKGRVMSEYQTKVEKEWIQSLHEAYNVEVNKKTLKKLKKELDS